MTLDLERLAGQFDKKGFPLVAKHLRIGVQIAENAGAPQTFLVETKENVLNLKQVVQEYKKNPTSPEKATAFWQAFWAENGKKVDISVSVPECPFTQEQLKEMRRKDKGPIYVPEELSIQKTRHLLGKIFPKMQSHSVEEDNSVTNEVARSGWRQFDISIDAPHLGIDESQLRKDMVSQGDEEPSLNEYIVASQASKLLTGKYLDENTWSRIFGSRSDGCVVRAFFDSDGYLYVVSDLYPGSRYSSLGGRFSRGVN